MVQNLSKALTLIVSIFFSFQFFLISDSLSAPITLNAIDTGSYDNFGRHFPNNRNYFVGFSNGVQGAADRTLRNFLVFDLPSIPELITSALLRIECPPSLFGCYASQQPQETYSLFNVSTSIPDLLAGSGIGNPGASIFADLGAGTILGSRNISPSDNNSVIDINLNSSALNILNGSSGSFAFGGAITSLSGQTNATEGVFASTRESSLVQLVLDTSPVSNTDPIPEPSTMLLFSTGLAGLVAWRWKARKRVTSKDY